MRKKGPFDSYSSHANTGKVHELITVTKAYEYVTFYIWI